MFGLEAQTSYTVNLTPEVQRESPSTARIIPSVWPRLKPYRRSLIASLVMLLVAVPLMNFHPLVWGIVADKLISGSLTSSSLAFWLAVMLFTYLVGVVVNAIHTYLLEKAGQAFVRDIHDVVAETGNLEPFWANLEPP